MAQLGQMENEAIQQLDHLIDEVRKLRVRSKYDDVSDLPDESRELASRLQAALDRLSLPSTSYGREAEALRGEPAHVRMRELRAVAVALREDISKGWVRSVSELLRADTFTDLLDNATELHSKGYMDAAAVVAGTALELHLK